MFNIEFGDILPELREEFPDILLELGEEEFDKIPVLVHGEQFKMTLLVGKLDQMIDIDAYQTEIHQCRRIRLYNEGVDGENDASDGIDDSQLDHG